MYPREDSISEFLSVVAADVGVRGLAGGAGNNVQVVGLTLDRSLYDYPKSAVFVIAGGATQGATNTLTNKSVAVFHGDAANMSDELSFAIVSPDTVVDTGTGTTDAVRQKFAVNLNGAKRYIRLKYTPNLSAGSIDTFTLAAVCVLGGEQDLPAV